MGPVYRWPLTCSSYTTGVKANRLDSTWWVDILALAIAEVRIDLVKYTRYRVLKADVEIKIYFLLSKL